jgi:hypothetical protein
MTSLQKQRVRSLLRKFKGTHFHHGDCVGSDAQAHEIALALNYKVVLHPPIDERKRAFCKGVFATREEKPYLKRNKDIVKESSILIATPKQFDEQERSGTWATIREGFRQDKDVYIVYPDGSVGREL